MRNFKHPLPVEGKTHRNVTLAFFSFSRDDCLTIWAATILSNMTPRKPPNRKAKHRVQARLNDADIALWNELKERTHMGNTAIICQFLNKGIVKDGTRELLLREIPKLTRMVERQDPQASVYLRDLIRKIAAKTP